MTLTNRVRLTFLTINILMTSYIHTMEDRIDVAIQLRYENLKIAVAKLLDPQICRENKDSILQSLEPEEKMLIDLALILARDHSRPVGLLAEFMILEDRLKEKIKRKFEAVQETPNASEHHISPQKNPEFFMLPWEKIVSVNSH